MRNKFYIIVKDEIPKGRYNHEFGKLKGRKDVYYSRLNDEHRVFFKQGPDGEFVVSKLISMT